MPHALLLSPDDQAVNAITGVLEEMSVTCERPLDGVSAAQKLNAQSFDLVLVDCENLPAAKLIFDVCRRGKNRNHPVPIAIVDGRAGLPTAFRLGAELILTKPVAKDQARSTIRTAVSRVRKDVSNSEIAPPLSTTAVTTEGRAQTVAAAGTSQLTSWADPAPNPVSSSLPTTTATATATATAPATTTATFSAPAVATKAKISSALDVEEEVDPPPTSHSLKSKPTSFTASSSESSSTPAASESSKPARPLEPSDDPVLAELERAEQEELERAQPQRAESQKLESQKSQKPQKQKQRSGAAKAAPDKPAAASAAPGFSSQRPAPQKTRGSLVALLVFVLMIGGLYAAWTYEPGFRAILQPHINRVLTLAGMALPLTPAPEPAKPSTHLFPAKTPASAPAPSTIPSSPQTAAQDSAKSAPTASASENDATKPSPNTPLPGENSLAVLSPRVAEERLVRSVPPKYSTEARSHAAEITVVLKAVIDENGRVTGVRLVEGDANLATVAINAVKQWRYRPYIRDGKAQPFQTVVVVDSQRP